MQSYTDKRIKTSASIREKRLLEAMDNIKSAKRELEIWSNNSKYIEFAVEHLYDAEFQIDKELRNATTQ